jgi:hypothetical protein
MKTNIKDIWDKLESSRHHNEAQFKLVVYEPLNCYLSILESSNTRCFELQVDSTSLKTFEKKFRGVEIYLVNLKPNEKSIIIYLLDSDLNEIFTLFIEDILNNIAGINDVDIAFRQVQNQFGKWGKLFAQINGRLISKEKQRGLFGELNFLKTIINRTPDNVSCVISWMGPHGSNQDFIKGNSAVEIKTSKATTPSIHIASELQLDRTVIDNLFLTVVHVDEINKGENTLFKLIKDLKEAFVNEPELLRLFNEKLDLTGIAEGEEQYYKDFGYVIRSQKYYLVQDGFPVLTNTIINNDAIHNVRYQIDISSCRSSEVNEEQVIKEII